MGTLLRVVMYVVAVVAGVDAYVVGSRSFVAQLGMSAGGARATAAILGAVLALILATIPIAIYQRVMRNIVAKRRAAGLSARAARRADGRPEHDADDVDDADVEAPRSWGAKHTYGVISRENRSLRWPVPEPPGDTESVDAAPEPVGGIADGADLADADASVVTDAAAGTDEIAKPAHR